MQMPRPGQQHRPQADRSGKVVQSAPQSHSRTHTTRTDLPEECYFRSFYGEDGHILLKVFTDAAMKTAECFASERLTRSGVRRLFQLFKHSHNQMRASGDKTLGCVQEHFGRFYRLVMYNNGRRIQGKPVLPDIFRKWVEAHLKVASSSFREFEGFLEYLTSVMAYLREK